MKKIITIFISYIVIFFIICLGISLLIKQMPVLIPGEEVSFRFNRAFLWFYNALPAIIFSGFSIACSVHWRKDGESLFIRFSSSMMHRYKIVFYISLVIIFVLFFTIEVLIPYQKNKIQKMEDAPVELNKMLNIANEFYEKEELIIALQYSRRAVEIDSKNIEANALVKKISDELEVLKNQKVFLQVVSEMTQPKFISKCRPIHTLDLSYSLLELISKAENCIENKDWINAHYWADLAVKACDGKSTIRSRAIELTNFAWNKIQNPIEIDTSFEMELFTQKRKGYTAYHAGDCLKAYYTFKSLEKKLGSKKDPDVERFLTLANESVESQYFFIDEIEYFNKLKSAENVYFTLQYQDGSKSVFFIKSLMNQKKTGGLIRYFENLNIVNYDKDGNFRYSFEVPYAKVLALPVNTFTEEAREEFGINKKWKNVPMIQLVSVDRETEGFVVKPEYSFKEDYQVIKDEKEIVDLDVDHNIMILPINYDDFSFLFETSLGPSNMNISMLSKFIKKAESYGFAEEIFRESFVNRICLPLFLLSLLIMCAAMAWNFRVKDEKTVFKFIWVLLFPIYTLIIHMIYSSLIYMYNILNYVLVGTLGAYAQLVAVLIYILFYLISSIYFLSRKS